MKNFHNKIISISGPSGVGKTSIANLMMCVLGQDSLILSGDDSHKWERGDPHWKRYTHLDPIANNLQNEKAQLLDLKNNKLISRRHYNHNTGRFDKEQVIIPKSNIIYEGLHTLYDKELQQLADLKIYVDTDEELKIAWKMKRDLKERGYTENQVINAIRKRTPDEREYILPQRDAADVIVKFKFSESGILFDYELNKEEYQALFDKIKSLYNLKVEFIRACNLLGLDSSLIQESGGNVSVKSDDLLIVTSSGAKLSDVGVFTNCCVCDKSGTPIVGHGRPSMETDSHRLLYQASVHTHPLDLLTLLCSEEARTLIGKLYNDYKYTFIDYITPGQPVAKYISQLSHIPEVLFLQNHGLFVTGQSLMRCLSITKEINQIAESYVSSLTKEHRIDVRNDPPPLFPDAAVLKEKNMEVNLKLYRSIINSGLTPRFLLPLEISELLNLESEKYRIGVTQ